MGWMKTIFTICERSVEDAVESAKEEGLSEREIKWSMFEYLANEMYELKMLDEDVMIKLFDD